MDILDMLTPSELQQAVIAAIMKRHGAVVGPQTAGTVAFRQMDEQMFAAVSITGAAQGAAPATTNAPPSEAPKGT